MYKLNLGLDEINEDVMKCNYRKTNTVKNYFYLLHDDLLHDKNTYHAEEQNSRLTIVRKLIKLLGWQHINDNKVFTKVVIIQEFKDKLVELFPEKKIELFTGDTDSKRKMEAAKDVINEWSQLDCLLYSPCFETGVNFDKNILINNIFIYVVVVVAKKPYIK